jgi:SAM-dependent methyltransferase
MAFDRHMTGPTPPEEEPAAVDLSAFGPGELANLALQRSEVLAGLDMAPGRIVRAWVAGDAGPLERAVATLGPEIARRAAASVLRDWRALAPALDALGAAPRRIADIGCGYGLMDLPAARETGAELVLIDIETSAERHFGFAAEGAGYADLGVARRFLTANGIGAERIATVNPTVADPAEAGQVDLIVSLLSCGFHYPVDTYLGYLDRALRPGGLAIFDLRRDRARAQIARLGRFGRVDVLAEDGKRVRVRMIRGARA